MREFTKLGTLVEHLNLGLSCGHVGFEHRGIPHLKFLNIACILLRPLLPSENKDVLMYA